VGEIADLPQSSGTAQVEVLREKQREAWLAENREAVKAYNSRIRKHGLFSDGLRLF